MHACVYTYIYIYDPVKTKPKNSVSFLCSALQRKETWLHFPFASLKAQYKPNISASHTCQSTASLLGSLFHWQAVQRETPPSCREQEAAVTPRTGVPSHFF